MSAAGRSPLLAATMALLVAACAAGPSPEVAGQSAGRSAASAEPATSAPALIRLPVSLSAINATATPLWTGVAEGTFREHGLGVEIINFDGGARGLAALLAGEVAISLVNATSVVDSRLAGGDPIMVATVFDTYNFQIFGRPGLTRPEDLRGKTIAVGVARAAAEQAVIEALGRFGLEPTRDYGLTYVGSNAARFALLEQGLVDAIAISPPTGLRAQEAGWTEVLNVTDLGLPYGLNMITTTESSLARDPAPLIAFLRGYLEALALAKRDRAAAERAIAQFTQESDPAVLAESYRLSVPSMADVPYVREDIVQAALTSSEYPGARTADSARFYDNRYVRELETSGFIRQVYGR
jgi:NitT/TauT family transport system substrate-binding protein